jgi:hypothetical protein
MISLELMRLQKGTMELTSLHSSSGHLFRFRLQNRLACQDDSHLESKPGTDGKPETGNRKPKSEIRSSVIM